MPLTAEQTARLTWLQGQIIHNKELTEDERKSYCREGVQIMKGDRIAAQVASTTSRTTAAKKRAPIDVGAALANLRNLGKEATP